MVHGLGVRLTMLGVRGWGGVTVNERGQTEKNASGLNIKHRDIVVTEAGFEGS